MTQNGCLVTDESAGRETSLTTASDDTLGSPGLQGADLFRPAQLMLFPSSRSTMTFGARRSSSVTDLMGVVGETVSDRLLCREARK